MAIRKIFPIILLALVAVQIQAQDLEGIKARIDSLAAREAALKASLESVSEELDSLRTYLNEVTLAREMAEGKLVMKTLFEKILRAEARGSGREILRIPPNELVVVLEKKNHYVRVRRGDKEGWLSEGGLKVYDDAMREREEREAEKRKREEQRRREWEKERREREEQERRAREALAQRGAGIGAGLVIMNSGFSTNSADGVSIQFALKNLGKRVYKYVTFEIAPFNSVGDPVYGDLSGKNYFSMTGVGPIEPGKEAYYDFDNVFYDGTATCIELRKVTVEYMKGGRFTYINDLKKIMSQEAGLVLRGQCKI